MKYLLLLLILTGCNQKVEEQKEIKEFNYEVSYNEEIYLYDLIDETNIITENKLIDTNELNEYNYNIEYETEIHNVTVKVKDTKSPLIFGSSSFKLKKDQSFDLLKAIGYGDDYDKQINMEMIGTFDVSTPGVYNITLKATDSSNNQTTKDITITVVDELTYGQATPIYLEDLIEEHKTENTRIGIDVSSWQDDINWQQVKDSGVEFAIIRLGFGHNVNGENVLDNRYLDNIKEAKEVGLDVGIYFFSYAKTEQEIIDQVNYIMTTLNGIKLELPIVFDWEDWEDFEEYNLSFTDLNNLADKFLTLVEENGYQAMLYGSASYLERVWDLDYLTWVAHYTDQTDYEKEYYIWQLSDTGIVPGIDGYTDLNILYE